GYQENVLRKLNVLEPDQESAIQKASDMAVKVNEKIFKAPGDSAIPKVEVLKAPSFRERLQEAVGPYLEFLAVSSFVLILVLFMMTNREDLRDRIVAVFGHSRVSLTTRTMDEIGQRISRYL